MNTMHYSVDDIRSIFKSLEQGDGAGFFTHVADNVDWTVEGHHPLAGHYLSKVDFIAGTFEKLGRVLPQGTQLDVTHAMVSGDCAIVELASLAIAKNGLRFENKYCWICKFDNNLITLVRAYLDSAMVQRMFDENPI